MARPSPLNEWTKPEKLLLVQGWARDGLSNDQMAHNIGVAPSTFYKWKGLSEEFAEAIKKGKEVVDREVENALLKRALGYEYEEVTVETYKTGDPKKGTQKVRETHVKKVKKQVAPDVGAIAFWLKNRKSADWRDRQEIVDNRAIDKLDEILKGQHESAIQQETD